MIIKTSSNEDPSPSRDLMRNKNCPTGPGEEHDAIAQQSAAHRWLQFQSHAQEIIITLSPRGEITSLNPAFEAVTAWALHDWTGKSLSLLIHPDDREYLDRVLTSAAAGVALPACQQRIRKKNGGYLIGELTATPLRTPDTVYEIIGVIRDITKRKQAEQGTQKARELYRTFMDSASDMAFLKDDRLIYVMVNRAYCEYLGRTSSSIIGSSDLDIMAREDSELSRLSDRQALISLSLVVNERSIGPCVYEFRKFPVWLGDNKIGVGGYIRDITERRRSDRAIREAGQSFRALMEQSLLGIYILQDNRFIYVNRAFAELTGHAPAALTGSKTVLDIIAEQDRELVLHGMIRRHRNGGRSLQTICKIIRANGELRDVEIHDTAIDFRGKPAVMGTMLDVTDRVKHDAVRSKKQELFYLKQKEESLATLAGGVAHDFNNLLMGVLGSAELLKMKGQMLPETAHLTDTIIGSAKRMASLTRQLLAYTRQTASPQMILSLQSLLEECIKDIPGLASNMTIEFSSDEAVWDVHGERDQIKQAITGLLTNAVEAMGENGGSVIIHLENTSRKKSWDCPLHRNHPAGDYVHVSIRDSGPGIPRKIRQKIFDPFFTTKFIGRGLGLAAASGILQKHGGCITLGMDSDPGAAFHVYVPRYKEETVIRKHTMSDCIADTTRDFVLVVDDELDVLTIVQNQLSSLGYSSIPATSGNDAISKFIPRKDSIRLAILDLHMQGMDGLSLGEILKRIKPGLRILISSGYNERVAPTEHQRGVEDDFIQKPFGTEVLRDKIKGLLST